MSSVADLTRSLDNFSRLLGQSGYSNILARYQEHLISYGTIIASLALTNGTIGSSNIEDLKNLEQSFYGDEADLMKIDTITSEQAEITQNVIESIVEACDGTNNILNMTEAAVSDVADTIDDASAAIVNGSTSIIGNNKTKSRIDTIPSNNH